MLEIVQNIVKGLIPQNKTRIIQKHGRFYAQQRDWFVWSRLKKSDGFPYPPRSTIDKCKNQIKHSRGEYD